jgi:nicotinamide mononucleotide transporter
MSTLETAANLVNALAIVLAGRNSIHTWWTGIIGCLLFGWLFFEAKLYADVTLQLFFIGTGIAGWRMWLRGAGGSPLAIGRTPTPRLAAMVAFAAAFALGYAWLLHRFTDAYSPLVDSLVLASSVLGQLLLMSRRVETWPCWLFANTLSVPLFWSRGLHLTSALYALFWVNALISLRHWHRLMNAPATA